MVTIEINERTKAGKALLEIVKIFSKDKKGVTIVSPSRKSKAKAYPISKNIPNAETTRIFKENDKKKGKGLKRYNNVDDLIEELNS